MMDWIQGDKFKEIADFCYTPVTRAPDDYDKSVNTLDFSMLRENNIIYTHTMYVKQLFEILSLLQLSLPLVIITHNSDINIDKTFIPPDNVIKWYTQNVNVVSSRIESIPIGVENNRRSPHLHKKELMEAKLRIPRRRKNLVYMNHNIKTNPKERIIPYNILERKSWVTSERERNGIRFESYLDNLYRHEFVICPEGNGMDTHRTWEALYIGSIPIEKKNINNQFYTDLPICFVDSWDQVTEEFLMRWKEDNALRKWNMEKLTFTYWKNKILAHA